MAAYQLPVTSLNDTTMTPSRPQYNCSYRDHQQQYLYALSRAPAPVSCSHVMHCSLSRDTDTSSGCSSTTNDVSLPSPPDGAFSRPPVIETDLDLVINDLDRVQSKRPTNDDKAHVRCGNIMTSSLSAESNYSTHGTSIDDVTEADHFLPGKTGNGDKMMTTSKRRHRPPPLPPPRCTSLVQ